MKHLGSQDIDANFVPISGPEAFKTVNTWTYVTATTGATGAHTLFTVTGDVIAVVFGLCKTNLAGAATLAVGVSGNTAKMVSTVADTTTIDANDSIGGATTGETLAATLDSTGVGGFLLANGIDIIMTIGATPITAGVIDWYCLWRPLSSDGLVTATTPA